MPDLTDNDFKVAIINILKELKETMIKEVQEGLVTMVPQIENINKYIEIIFKLPNANSEGGKYNNWNKFTRRF